MPVPTYVFHGSADPIVPVARVARCSTGMSNVTRRVHDGLRHECHHEPEHEHVLAEVVAWLRANAPAAARRSSPRSRCRLAATTAYRLRGARYALRVWLKATDPRNLIRFVPV